MVNKYVYVTGGADKQCMSLAESLRAGGHQVAFLAMASEKNLETEGVFVPTSVTHETRDALSARARAVVLRQALWNRYAARAMEHLIHDFRPDVVHAHRLYPQLSVAPIVVARRQEIPIVQTLHDYEFLSASPFDVNGAMVDRRDSRLAYRMLNTATLVIRRRVHVPAVSEWIAVSDFVARAHATRGIDATVIPNFADADSERAPLSLEHRDGLLFLGALSEEKGVLDVLELARELPDIRVVIAGRGPLLTRVAAAADEITNIEFRGHLDSAAVMEAVRSARIVLVPSRWEEPGSLVSLEAMAAGTPIVAYKRGGLAEYVAHAAAGLTVEMDPGCLVWACRTLLDDAVRWQECATAGLRASRTTFSREVHTRSVLDAYERAVANGPAPPSASRVARDQSMAGEF